MKLVGWKYLKYQKLSSKSPYPSASPNNKKQDYDAKIHTGTHDMKKLRSKYKPSSYPQYTATPVRQYKPHSSVPYRKPNYSVGWH